VYSGGVLPDRRGDSPTTAAPRDYRGLFLVLHSYSQRVLWPWAYSTAATGNATALRTLGRRLAWFNGYKPQQWIDMYAADGTTTDTMYGLLGVPSYTIEMGVAFFEDCSTFESSTYPKNLNVLRYAARTLTAPYQWPAGPDTYSVSASPSRVSVGATVTITATVDDSRFNQGNGAEPVQAISSAAAYLDRQPWLSRATPPAMQANDGAFNSSREVVSVRLSTAGLAAGRHLVFVRGKDGSGHFGPPEAVFFTVQ
jgi:carboxypeptidase T